jgi:hypothetical protein
MDLEEQKRRIFDNEVSYTVAVVAYKIIIGDDSPSRRLEINRFMESGVSM